MGRRRRRTVREEQPSPDGVGRAVAVVVGQRTSLDDGEHVSALVLLPFGEELFAVGFVLAADGFAEGGSIGVLGVRGGVGVRAVGGGGGGDGGGMGGVGARGSRRRRRRGGAIFQEKRGGRRRLFARGTTGGFAFLPKRCCFVLVIENGFLEDEDEFALAIALFFLLGSHLNNAMRPPQQILPLPLLLAPHPHVPPPGHVPHGILQSVKVNPRIQILPHEEIRLLVSAGDRGDAHSRIAEEGRGGRGWMGGGGIYSHVIVGGGDGGGVVRSVVVVVVVLVVVGGGGWSARHEFVPSQDGVIDFSLVVERFGIDPLDLFQLLPLARSQPTTIAATVVVVVIVIHGIPPDDVRNEIQTHDGTVVRTLPGRIGRSLVVVIAQQSAIAGAFARIHSAWPTTAGGTTTIMASVVRFVYLLGRGMEYQCGAIVVVIHVVVVVVVVVVVAIVAIVTGFLVMTMMLPPLPDRLFSSLTLLLLFHRSLRGVERSVE
mmetsp:Transcript_29864/g.54908  ORF Transcript_29864/g.54908 Transcript_29864/m.54908 type:complete len:487 (-) Transcript_29864:500-1960(-)